ncbi:MAG TPA: M56 family metallopeptidase [Pseudoduganella sp.]|jgi:beta-lactamase regulating signal transducer with metallopeptidase domain
MSALLPAASHALLHALWQIALLALCAGATLHALRHHTAAARHTAGMAWLLAMVLAPLATAIGFLAAPHAPMQPPTGFPSGQAPMATAPALWLAGVGMMAALRLRDWRALLNLEQQRFTRLPAAWSARFEAIRLRMGIAAPVQVRVGTGCGMSPFTARLLRPIVWLPLAVLTHLPPDQVSALLAHELAHIRRKDWLWNGLQCAAESLLFFHPGMWWLSRRIRQERENACDDLAVATGADPIALAEGLTALHRLRQPRARHPVPAFALAAGGGVLLARVTRILAAPGGKPLGMRTAGALAALLCAALLLAHAAPRLEGGMAAPAGEQAAVTPSTSLPARPARPAPSPVHHASLPPAVIQMAPVPPEPPTLRQTVPALPPPPPRPTTE